jgi:hypothetical protein
VDEAKTPEPARQRLARTLIVPILLLAALGSWFWLGQQAAPGAPATAVAARPNATAAATRPLDAPPLATAAEMLVGLATPWGAAGLEPTATATPSAVVAPGSIDVYGPPAGSRFRAADEVAFYWSWPDELAEGQRFVLYLVATDRRRALGEVDELNLGRAYQLRAAVGEAGDFRWEVVLEDESTGAIIAVSEARAISAIDG